MTAELWVDGGRRQWAHVRTWHVVVLRRKVVVGVSADDIRGYHGRESHLILERQCSIVCVF